MKFLTKLGNSITGKMGRTGLKLRKHSPEILIVVGIGGVITSAVLACRATLKAGEIVNDHKEKLETIKDARQIADERPEEVDAYPDKDYKRDITVTYVQTGVQFAKLYGPAILLGIVSICCLVGSHRIMKARYSGAIAAYTALDEAFKKYRKRVVDEHGEEADYLYRNGLKKETVVEIGEDGKPVEKEKLVSMYDNLVSQYAVEFGPNNPEWATDVNYNVSMLRGREKTFTDLLIKRGHVFLSEVYDKLGIPHTDACFAGVGWVKGYGNDFVSFGIDSPNNDAFIMGENPVAILDFNVDGMVYDIMNK